MKEKCTCEEVDGATRCVCEFEMSDDEVAQIRSGRLPLNAHTFLYGLPPLREPPATGLDQEIIKLADLRRRVDALGAPALITKLESEGRIDADDRASVTKLVAALGLEGAARLAATWPIKVCASANYQRWKQLVSETATKLGISQTEACAHVTRAEPDLTRLAFAEHT